MKNIILTLLSFFGSVILFFIALLYAQMDVGIKNIHYDLLIEDAFMMSLKLHFIILPIHFLISRRKWERYFKKVCQNIKILVFRFLEVCELFERNIILNVWYKVRSLLKSFKTSQKLTALFVFSIMLVLSKPYSFTSNLA